MVAEIYGVHGSDTKERKWDLIVGSFAGGRVGVHLFCPRFGLHVMLLISNQFCRTAEQRALHVGSLNERLRDMATDEFDPTSRQEELRKCDT